MTSSTAPIFWLLSLYTDFPSTWRSVLQPWATLRSSIAVMPIRLDPATGAAWAGAMADDVNAIAARATTVVSFMVLFSRKRGSTVQTNGVWRVRRSVRGFERGHCLEGVLGGAGEDELAGDLLELSHRDCHIVLADSEEPAGADDRVGGRLVGTDDDVIDGSDLLAFV